MDNWCLNTHMVLLKWFFLHPFLLQKRLLKNLARSKGYTFDKFQILANPTLNNKWRRFCTRMTSEILQLGIPNPTLQWGFVSAKLHFFRTESVEIWNAIRLPNMSGLWWRILIVCCSKMVSSEFEAYQR